MRKKLMRAQKKVLKKATKKAVHRASEDQAGLFAQRGTVRMVIKDARTIARKKVRTKGKTPEILEARQDLASPQAALFALRGTARMVIKDVRTTARKKAPRKGKAPLLYPWTPETVLHHSAVETVR